MHAHQGIVSPQLLHDDGAEWVVIDTRFDLTAPAKGRSDYLTGHIPGAYYAHLDDDLASPPGPLDGRHPLPEPARLAELLGGWGIGEDTQVVVYDQGGGAIAARLWWLLRWLGHTRVAVLDGGYAAWCEAGYRTDDTDENAAPPRPAVFRPRPDPDMVLDVEALARGLAAGEVLLVDARDAARFAGRCEPIDPVAGHVPGALNRPFSDNLDERGRMLSAPRLHSEYAALLAGRPPRELVAMCGSGVTACHLLLAMQVGGLPGGRLYAGSWSEWIRDSARPRACA